ncbi:unnamed protein product [Camellia sinensis]
MGQKTNEYFAYKRRIKRKEEREKREAEGAQTRAEGFGTRDEERKKENQKKGKVGVFNL